jgi:hypothetical protein
VDVDVLLLEQFVLDAQARARLRTTVRAASTDSFITSPSEPVRWMTPLPGISAASIVSRSPPTSVHARPTTWPTWFCRFGAAVGELAHAQEVVQVVLR